MNRLSHLDPYLVHSLIHDIIIVAQRGWDPHDLQHVLGPASAVVLEKAAFQVPARVQMDKVRKSWLSYRPSDYELSLASTLTERTVTSWLDKLYRLPFLRDAEVVASPQPEFTDPKQKKMHEKIQALLAKAESTQFEDEADALIAKAQNLRQQYRIDSVLEDLENSAEEIVALRVRISAPWVKHQHSLLCSVAYANGGTAVLLSDFGICTVMATRDDAEHIIDLFTSLNRQRAWFMKNSEGAKLAAADGETASYRRSFIMRLRFASCFMMPTSKPPKPSKKLAMRLKTQGLTKTSTSNAPMKLSPALSQSWRADKLRPRMLCTTSSLTCPV